MAMSATTKEARTLTPILASWGTILKPKRLNSYHSELSTSVRILHSRDVTNSLLSSQSFFSVLIVLKGCPSFWSLWRDRWTWV